MVRMPFGKFKGCLLEEIRRDYLQWLLGLNDLDAWLRHAVKAELSHRPASRARRSRPDDAAGRSHPPPVDWLAILGQVRRRLALQHHPDRGGSIERMAGINLAIDAVESELAGVS